MSKKKKEAPWTQQCRDGRACAKPVNWAEITKTIRASRTLGKGTPRKPLPLPSAEKDMATAAFIPDDALGICDYCLAAKYELEARYDTCDQIGLGPQYVELDAVLRALRRAEGGNSEKETQ